MANPAQGTPDPSVGYDVMVAAFVERRQALGLTQEDVANQLGMNFDHFRKLEVGLARPSLFDAHCWACVLGGFVVVAWGSRPPQMRKAAQRRPWCRKAAIAPTVEHA